MKRVALFLVAAPLALANAQDLQTAELVKTRVTVSESLARKTCTAIPHRELYADPPISHTCTVVEFDTLDRAVGKRWSFVVQRHTSVYDFHDSLSAGKLDSIVEIESILFSAPRDSRTLTAVLNGREEEAVIRSIYPEIAERNGTALVSVEFCVNGTAGCWQQFLRYDAKAWYHIDDPIAAIRSRVLETFHGDSSHIVYWPHINIGTLHGVASVGARGDANCCPSNRAEFQLALDGNRFRIVDFKIFANDSLKSF